MKVSLLSWYGASEDLRQFFVIPVTENKLSTGTEDALGVRKTRASRLSTLF